MSKSNIKTPGAKAPRVFFFFLISAAFLFSGFLVLDRIFPIDLKPRTITRIVLAEDGTPLRAFADENGIWRYPVSQDQVSPLYTQALLGYEDRWFYYHPGINPFSMVRAAWQWASTGRVISGGSTITMQVARLRRPSPRSVPGKIKQMFAALQLEWHYDKGEILTYYLNHAPFGGTFEGVQAACYAYFDHGAGQLTHAQAALLAVMPQSPSRFRPDRFPEAAKRARNKCLKRLLSFGIWKKPVVEEALLEPLMAWPVTVNIAAPLLSRRLNNEIPPDVRRIDTFISYPLQEAMEQLACDYAAGLPPHVSIAVLAMENQTGAVKSYVGSADFRNKERFGHVDMVKAMRSPGSSVKPFIYGMALDQGLICSQSMLMDIPIRFGDYQPVNFHRSFSGPVSSSSALSQSLNLPAVQLMDHLDPRFFYAHMLRSGFKIKLPAGAKPNLSMALGGFSTNLENLVLAYSSLGRKGITLKPRLTPEDPMEESTLVSEGAAWIVHDMLIPERSRQIRNTDRQFAVKTGTSYGFRDSWAVGVNRSYTVGVWIGRPDGTPVPGHYGAQTATPLLKLAFRLLPRHESLIPKPASVAEGTICWPDGKEASPQNTCREPRTTWLLDRTAPPTLTPNLEAEGPAVKTIMVSTTPDGKYRIPGNCNYKGEAIRKEITLWPAALESWIPAPRRRKNLIPMVIPTCNQAPSILIQEPIKIEGIENGEVILKKDEKNDYPEFHLRVTGGNGPWYWFRNSVQEGVGEKFVFRPDHPGAYQVLVVDQSGAIDQVTVEVF